MRIRLPDWLYQDPAMPSYTNSELSQHELGRIVTLPLLEQDSMHLARIELELELPALLPEQLGRG